MTFLIVTNRRDLTADYVVRELRRRGHPFVRLNTETIATGQVSINPKARSFRISLPGCRLHLEEVRAAYFRRPEEPSLPSAGIDPVDCRYAVGEWNGFLKSIYLYLGDKWFSHPASIMLAEDKPRQLLKAVEIGFNVPDGVITNDFEDIAPLAERAGIIGKPLKSSLVSEEGPGSVVFTSAIKELREAERSAISVCPAIYQVEIQKDCDVRVTVVGNKAFAAAIHSQGTEVSRVDWRRGSNPDLVHQPIPLPPKVVEMCIHLVRALDLRFGAIDLIRDKEGEFWFLECNPNGQWAWIENRTALPITAAIVDELERIANR